MEFLVFLFKTGFDMYVMIFMLGIWMKWKKCDFFDPFVGFVNKLTQPLINYIEYLFPKISNKNYIFVFLFFVTAFTKYFLLVLFEKKKIFLNFKFLFVMMLSFLKIIGEVVFWVITIHSLLKIFEKKYDKKIDMIIYQLSCYLINKIRIFVPLIFEIDFSILILIIFLYFIDYIGMDLFPEIWIRL